MWRFDDRLLSDASVFFGAVDFNLDTGARKFLDLEEADCVDSLIDYCTIFEIALTISLEDFFIVAAFFISSLKEEPNKKLSAGMVSVVFLARVKSRFD